MFLNPLDNKTHRYVENTWNTLNSGNWPPSSPAGQLCELHWRLRCGGGSALECDVHLVDPSGQDLRRLFSDDEADSGQNLPELLRRLADYCKSAEIVICLVNLKDFIGENDPQRRVDNEVVIKSALQRLSDDNNRMQRLILLFTQIDQYKPILARYGNWSGVAKEHLPYVYGAHLSAGKVWIGAVAAVNETRVVVNAENIPRRVPAPGFGSKGLNELMSRLVLEATAIAAQHEEQRKLRGEAERRMRAEEIHAKGKWQVRNSCEKWGTPGSLAQFCVC